jgi:hypothetical protein
MEKHDLVKSICFTIRMRMHNILKNMWKVQHPYTINKHDHPMNLTLNSSNVKLTKRTPHQCSITKFAGCAGSNSFAIDLLSFHIIF